MLRKLREQWWYMLLWLPLVTALGLLTAWLWLVAHVLGGWAGIRYDLAPDWGLLSLANIGLFAIVLIFLFPRKPARNLKGILFSVSLVVVTLCILYFAKTHFEVEAPRFVLARPNIGLTPEQKTFLKDKANQILVKLNQVCSEQNLKYEGSTNFQPDGYDINQDSIYRMSITGPVVRMDSKDQQFEFRMEDNRLTSYQNTFLSNLIYGKDAPLYEKPNTPKWSTDQAIQIATAFRDVLLDPSGAKIGKPEAKYDHTNFQWPKSRVGEWFVCWPRVDSKGHPFFNDHVTISFPEGYGPLGAGIYLTTPYTEEKGEPMPQSVALARVRSLIYWQRVVEKLVLMVVLANEGDKNIVDQQLKSAELVIVIPQSRDSLPQEWNAWSFFRAKSYSSARLAWIFWFQPVHDWKGHPPDAYINDSFAVWVDAYTGEIIGGDAMM